MTPLDFAKRYFYSYRHHGTEIIPQLCPYCHGGEHHDKYTFALNIDKLTFNCKRGSCGVTGTFSKLCADFGEEADKPKQYETLIRPKKVYKKPETKIKPLLSSVEKYLMSRGFSKRTWERRGVGDDGKGNIVMPYLENGELVLMKFRPGRKIKKGEKKGWREEGGKPVFWGMDLCDISKPLVITEGEMDALALDEVGIENVVSVPSGAEDLTCVEECWDWLQQFKKYILWVDNDDSGHKLQRNLISRLSPAKCWVVVNERKDANEVLVFDGKEKTVDSVKNAIEVPISGLLRLSNVRPFDPNGAVKIASGFWGIDQIIGGFMMGQTTIWTGINSSGKSTLLGQVMLNAIDQGFSVFAYSGELPAPVFKYWIDLQAAGPDNLEFRLDMIKQSDVPYPTITAKESINHWYRDKFFLFDNYGTVTEENLLEVFEYAAQRYGCKMFMIDNLMTTCLSGNENDFYRKQSEFVGKVIQFAQKHEAHVHLVAHPRKSKGRLTKMDVGGSGDITNRADNVLSVHRLRQGEAEEWQCDALVDIFKNRFSGKQDVAVKLNFYDKCKRFYSPSEPQGYKYKLGWSLKEHVLGREVTINDCPF